VDGMGTREITLQNLDETITSNDIVLLDFWAAWCAPCRAFAPVFEKAAEANPDVVFGKVDTEAERELAAGFQITAIPTLMAFRGGVLVFAQPGMLTSAQLARLVDEIRKIDMDDLRAQLAKQESEAVA
jgi:thioredoxin